MKKRYNDIFIKPGFPKLGHICLEVEINDQLSHYGGVCIVFQD